MASVSYYVTIGGVCLALVGNLLMFVVFSMKSYHGSMASMLYRILAVAQTLYVLISDGLHSISLHVRNISLYAYSFATCKAFLFMQIWLRACIAWVLAIIALERVIGVILPHRAPVLNTKRRYGCLLFGMSLFLLVIYAPLIFVVEHGNSTGMASVCMVGRTDGTMQWYSHGLYKWMTLVINSLLPFVVIISFNIAIIAGLIKSYRSVASPANSSSPLVKFNSQIAILMSISLTFIAMSLPYPIYFLIADYYKDQSTVPTYLNNLGLLGPICDTMTNSITIVFYCLFGSKFRQCLKQLFCSKCKLIKCWSVSGL